MPENGIAEPVLAEMEARANAATAGPWRASLSAPMIHGGQYEGVSAGGTMLLRLIIPSFKSNGPDAEFIAHSRADVPVLIAEVRRLSRLSLYDPRTHVCVEREDMEAERAAIIRAGEDGRRGSALRTLHALNQWLSTPESK